MMFVVETFTGKENKGSSGEEKGKIYILYFDCDQKEKIYIFSTIELEKVYWFQIHIGYRLLNINNFNIEMGKSKSEYLLEWKIA